MQLKKIVAIEPVSFLPESRKEILEYCDQVIFYDKAPADAQEIIDRIKDADGILVSYKNKIGEEILSSCPNVKYIGMCCSLYSEESSNVDIRYAREHGITVTGIKDYGDEGVAEYVLGALIPQLHGTGGYEPFLGEESELSGIKVGILGMGATAQIIGKYLSCFGVEISYYSRTRKPELEKACGYTYKELPVLLKECNVICSCLSKNVTLLHEKEFEILGDNKILFNTALSPCFDPEHMKKWLAGKNTWYYCDNLMAVGDEDLLSLPNVSCNKKAAGMTKQAVKRLNEKVLENLKGYCRL